jgi:hypothetical protein
LPNDKENEVSFNAGIEMHIDYCKNLVHMQFKGVKEDLYTVTPNLSQSNWVDDSTISQLLLGQDEPLFTIGKKSQYSPFLKLYRDENGWTLLWTKANHTLVKYYLQIEFRKNLTTWTGTDYSSLRIEVPAPVEVPDNDTETKPVIESEDAETAVDEYGRTHRLTMNTETEHKPVTITADRASQTTNAISSLTGQSHPYFQQYGYSTSGAE